MKLLLACLLLSLAFPVLAQTIKPGATDPIRERAIKRCKENRGTDCESKQGLREWIRGETPLTKEQQQGAAAARRHKQLCAQTKSC